MTSASPITLNYSIVWEDNPEGDPTVTNEDRWGTIVITSMPSPQVPVPSTSSGTPATPPTRIPCKAVFEYKIWEGEFTTHYDPVKDEFSAFVLKTEYEELPAGCLEYTLESREADDNGHPFLELYIRYDTDANIPDGPTLYAKRWPDETDELEPRWRDEPELSERETNLLGIVIPEEGPEENDDE